MNVILGILFHSLGGGASGSWYMPYNWVKKWRWEIYWITGGIFSWFIMPFLAVLLTTPDWQGILHATNGSVIRNTYIMGLLVGDWRPDLWAGNPLSRHVAGKFSITGNYFCSWLAWITRFTRYSRVLLKLSLTGLRFPICLAVRADESLYLA